MGCLLDLPNSGKPSGSLDWLWQIELGRQDPADQPDCLDPRYQPGKQPRNEEKKKRILRNNAKSILFCDSLTICHSTWRPEIIQKPYCEILLPFFLVINLQNPLKPIKTLPLHLWNWFSQNKTDPWNQAGIPGNVISNLRRQWQELIVTSISKLLTGLATAGDGEPEYKTNSQQMHPCWRQDHQVCSCWSHCSLSCLLAKPVYFLH